MAAPENIKAGFIKEQDIFAEHGIRYVAPFVSLDEPRLVPKQLYEGARGVIPGPHRRGDGAGGGRGLPGARRDFNERLRARSRARCWSGARARTSRCLMVLARPYHMDPGIGHEIEVDLQAYGYPILWMQYFPIDDDLMRLGVRRRHRGPATSSRRSTSTTSGRRPTARNTNEILWGAKVAARIPWIACVIRLSSYECGMDQPTYTPVQQIVERSGTLFFSFQDLDSTKPAGLGEDPGGDDRPLPREVRGRHHREEEGGLAPGCPLLPRAAEVSLTGV